VWAQTELDLGQQTMKAAVGVRPPSARRAQQHPHGRRTALHLRGVATDSFTVVTAFFFFEKKGNILYTQKNSVLNINVFQQVYNEK